jgi:hypothetical protein
MGKSKAVYILKFPIRQLLQKNYFDADGQAIKEDSEYSRHTIEFYGEVGIYKNYSALVWNIPIISHKNSSSSAVGIGSSYIGLQAQYLVSVVNLGFGLGGHFSSPQDSSELAFSQNNSYYQISHYLGYHRVKLNLHYLFDQKDQAFAYDFLYQFHPYPNLYLTTVVRGQKKISNLTKNNLLGYGMNTEYIAPGVEVFYSLNTNWHTVAALYTGTLMKNIYAFPGIKIGIAYSIN